MTHQTALADFPPFTQIEECPDGQAPLNQRSAASGRANANRRNGESQTMKGSNRSPSSEYRSAGKPQPHLPTFASTSVTVIGPGAGCPITSTAAVSTTGATGCFTFRAVFFTGAGLGLALATVRFAALATLRALLRLAEFPRRSLARLCTFDPFLRLAMIGPLPGW